jgi:hypothetical protein
MVYCPRCGTLNADDAAICKNCGASLQVAPQPNYNPYYRPRHRHGHYHDDYFYHHGAGWGSLFVGIVIILVGSALLLSEIYGFSINWSAWWAVAIVLLGVWLIFVAFRRSRRYRAPP